MSVPAYRGLAFELLQKHSHSTSLLLFIIKNVHYRVGQSSCLISSITAVLGFVKKIIKKGIGFLLTQAAFSTYP